MPQVLVALPSGLEPPDGQHRCSWASQWNGRFAGAEQTGGQRVELYSFGHDDDATLFAHATCHHLATWTDGCQGEAFTVSLGDDRSMPGRIGSKCP